MTDQTEETIKVWDPVIRLSHWALLLAFIIAYITGEDENITHAYAGYVILVLITIRILWGFIGTTHARFSNFMYSPGTTLEYLKSLLTYHPKRYLGHNPAGGMMVIILLAALLVASFTGLKAYGVEGHGPLAADSTSINLISSAHASEDHYGFNEDHEDEEDEYEHDKSDENEKDEFWEEIHEASVDVLLLLIIVHVLGVIVSSYLHNENLITSMITGKKQSSSDTRV